MDDSVCVKVLNGREHLAHDVSSMPLCEALSSHNPVKELTSFAVLHHNMNVAMINVTLVELDDVGVVHGLEDSELFFKQTDVFGNVCAQNRLDGVSNLRV